jgi:uncharacterized repeat protein (TIGR03803 family)
MSMKFAVPTSRLRSFGFLPLIFMAASIVCSAQTYTTLFSFDQTNGWSPAGIPTQGIDGNFYGTTMFGGAEGSFDGTAFKITPAGKQTVLHNFCSVANCADGDDPFWGLTLATDGNFYGTASAGGANSGGTLFKMSSAGKLAVLYNFCGSSDGNCTDGGTPEGGVIQGIDGNFYGTARSGGNGPLCFSNGYCGAIFKVTRTGTESVLYNFCSQPNCTDGVEPIAPLVQGTDGNFYGSTSSAAGNENPTIFKITPAGKLTTLYTFTGTGLQQVSGVSGLIQATDGNFYGTTARGGTNGNGLAFKITPGGTLTTLYNFCSVGGCLDGADPLGGVIQGSDGNLYGTTSEGGANANGTNGGILFRMTLSGAITTLYTFCSKSNCADGDFPPAPPVQGTDGNFYGFAQGGIGNEPLYGVVYKLSTGLAPFIKFLPAGGKVGSEVGILGNGLTGTTSVTFNGTAATFKVVSSTLITVNVPTGATSGVLQVVTPSRTLSSLVSFHVLP